MDFKMKKYRFAGEEVEAPESMSVEDVRRAWAELLPGIENAIAEVKSDGSVDFIVQAGTKG